ncbi:hypothetical protein O181_056308 [Austropuccinia psidii MF-1]|uniref:Reverse transcriptase Ty1/copia-type domain-containing protein n=1 Tax=Austropuccinia psidii MF-1 TaxID=1389203 RepID=A0A9Q3HTB2_9BASI|nr:hypothetical protein [Austropuccinia psidii MF-1]
MEKYLQNNTNVNENNLNIDVSSSEDENELFFIDTLEQKPQRIRVIVPRHPTLISSEINCENILPLSERQPRANITNQTCSTPKSFNEAMSSSNEEDWNTEIKKELMNMERLNISGLDYQRTFAPTGRLSSLHTLISFATIHKYEFHQMDVQSAFLNTPLQEEICLEIPQGILANKETQLFQLNKALYGIKQASLAWYKHLTKWLITLGFQYSINYPCVFWRKGKSPIWIYVHVDDLAIFESNLENRKQEIKKDSYMKDLGKAHLLLGIKINHLSDGFSLNQEH